MFTKSNPTYETEAKEEEKAPIIFIKTTEMGDEK